MAAHVCGHGRLFYPLNQFGIFLKYFMGFEIAVDILGLPGRKRLYRGARTPDKESAALRYSRELFSWGGFQRFE